MPAAELARLIAIWKPKRQRAGMTQRLKELETKPPEKLVMINREGDGESLKIEWGGGAISIKPGEVAFGRTYEE
jgi:hypothetical protein